MINDVLINGKRLANIFNTRDLAWHAQQIKPIFKFFSMSRLMDIEPLLDATINMLTFKLNEKFVDGPSKGKVCMMDDWLGWCLLTPCSFVANLLTV